MPKLSEMAANSAALTFSWNNLEFHVEYRPGNLDDATWTQIDAGNDARNQALTRLVTTWDVQEEDGSLMPIDVEHMALLPASFKLALSIAIMGDVRPNAGASATT